MSGHHRSRRGSPGEPGCQAVIGLRSACSPCWLPGAPQAPEGLVPDPGPELDSPSITTCTPCSLAVGETSSPLETVHSSLQTLALPLARQGSQLAQRPPLSEGPDPQLPEGPIQPQEQRKLGLPASGQLQSPWGPVLPAVPAPPQCVSRGSECC